MFRHICLTMLLVIASGNLSSSQNISTVAPTSATAAPTLAPTTATTTTPTPAPTTANTTTIAPTPANTTTIAPTPANTTTIAPTPANTTTIAPTPANTTTIAPTPANTTTIAPTPANTTTIAPTPANTTTIAPTPANTTTPAPTPANTTTPAPTPSPLPSPQTGNYTLHSQANSTACFMARMGLQLSYKLGEEVHSVNLDPKASNVSGSCGSNGSDSILKLDSKEISMLFVFANVTNRFRLHSLNVTVTNTSGGKLSFGNTSLALWEASVGSSYMCRKEQSYDITSALALHTFDLQVQPFAVEEDKFSTAHECAMDDSSILIPIIVGAALAGLILIVVIAYMIGRRKTYVGYQTL